MGLIRTVDTSVANLAGALGKKTLLMLHYQSDWRWQTEESSTHWYQNMEIIRLQIDTLWGSIFPRIQSKILAVHTR